MRCCLRINANGQTGGVCPFFVLDCTVFWPRCLSGDLRWRCLAFYVFTNLSAFPTPSGGVIVLFLVFTGIVFSVGPPGAPSFVARRKIGEKGVPRGLRPPLDPRGNVLGHSDVLCANRSATVRVTRLSRAWRAPHCFHALCVLRCQGYGNAYDFTGHRSTHESVEAVRSTPRTGLNRVNCIWANS